MSSVETVGASARDAKRAIDETVSDVRAKGEEVAERAHDALGTLREIVDESIRTRPYTTLMMAGAAGFLYAVLRRR
jgi:ElaB/YqjD/DUF883 family membrane-anchored ribosome-binding protein